MGMHLGDDEVSHTMYHPLVTVNLTSDLVLIELALCPVHISYIICGRYPKFGV